MVVFIFFWIFVCFVMIVFILLLFRGLVNFVEILLNLLSKVLVFVVFFIMLLRIFLFGLSCGFCVKYLIVVLFVGWVLFEKFWFSFVMIFRRVDLLVLFIFMMLILVFGKKFKWMFLSIWCLLEKVLDKCFIWKIYCGVDMRICCLGVRRKWMCFEKLVLNWRFRLNCRK